MSELVRAPWRGGRSVETIINCFRTEEDFCVDKLDSTGDADGGRCTQPMFIDKFR